MASPVFKGSAVLKTSRGHSHIHPGTLFFTFPYQPYEITGSENFTYLSITFDGDGTTVRRAPTERSPRTNYSKVSSTRSF